MGLFQFFYSKEFWESQGKTKKIDYVYLVECMQKSDIALPSLAYGGIGKLCITPPPPSIDAA
jgi:hypothetical protein